MRTLGRVGTALLWCAVVPLLVAATLLPGALLVREVSMQTQDWWDEVPETVSRPTLPQRSVILDANGDKLAEVYLYNRVVISKERMPQYALDAAVAVEDRRFYQHEGVDYESTGRAILTNLRAGSFTQGGSGITQQYVKNLLGLADLNGDPEESWAQATEKSLDRKWREARYAIALERTTTKDDILAGYLNTSYFGNGAYGIQAAARFYFGRNARDLTLTESALLIGLLQSPGAYDPFVYPEAAKERRNVVLRRMVDNGYITWVDYREAIARPLGAEPHALPGRCASSAAPFYCTWIEQELLSSPLLGQTEDERRAALAQGGLVIRTGLDPERQQEADQAIKRLAPQDRLAAAAAVVEPGTGVVQALSTSRTWGQRAKRGETELLLPTREAFQIGSVFKAFTLATALDRGVDPEVVLPAGQTYTSPIFDNPDKGYFSNYDATPWQDMTLVDATKWSVNTAFIQLQEMAGTRRVAKVAHDLGLVNLPIDGDQAIRENEGSLTLGARETSVVNVAAAYASLAAGGYGCAPRGIVSVETKTGGALPGAKPYPACSQVISPAAAATTTAVLANVIEEGTGQAAKLPGRPAAGKTGTTNNAAAVWFAGYTPQLAAAVWVGDPRGPQYSVLGEVDRFGESSSVVPQLIWRDLMSQALEGAPVEPLPNATTLTIVDWAGQTARQTAGLPETSP